MSEEREETLRCPAKISPDFVDDEWGRELREREKDKLKVAQVRAKKL